MDSQVAYISSTHNNMFTLRVLVERSRGQVRPHHFIGCDHRQDGLVKDVRFSDVVNTETLGEIIYWSISKGEKQLKFDKLEIGEGLKKEDKIYRYISLIQFMSLVENNTIYLTRLTVWDDTWEVPSINLPTMKDNGGIQYPLYSGGSDLFGQCWTLKKESDAMWRIYSPTKDGIKISTSIEKLELIQGLNHSAINKVYYYNDLIYGLKATQKFSGLSHLFSDGLIKRDAFEHEEEVRLITRNDKRLIGDKVSEGNYIDFKVNPFELIEEIVIDPRCSDNYLSTITKYCQRAGFKIKPIKSDLYCKDIYDKTKLVRVWKEVKE